MIKTQRLAATVIGEVLSGASLTAVLQTSWRANSALSSQQRGAVQDISYGVLRFYGQLGAILELLLKKSLHDRQLRHLLLVSLYQLQYSKTPPHAVVDNAVSSARHLRGGKGAQGLVNAVLRNFMRHQALLVEQAAKSEVGYYSHPQWWIDKLRLQYPQRYQTVLQIDNQHPPMTLRVNQRKIKLADYRQLLYESNMDAQLLFNYALRLSQPVAVEKLPGFAAGLVTVQDAGAQLAAPFLDVHDGMRVLDACAAPGGKSSHLLEIANVQLTALDINRERLSQVAQNLDRLKSKQVDLICGDAAQPKEWWNGKPFDRILADVPCSASGVVRRHPDIKWLRRETDLLKFVVSQQAILNSLWPTLSKGGKLLYATCSVFAEENKLQTKKFLCHHSDACQLPLEHVGMVNGQLLPDLQYDGFFYTLLHKT